MSEPKLWTKNFTILTVGSAISMLGNSVSAFAISLLVLDKTGSVFLYALFLAAYNLPRIILPLIAGPYLDKRSRRKTVYTLDFISAAVFLFMFIITESGFFYYPVFLVLCIMIGCIDSVYAVAYDSFFPMLVSEGNFSKAYSISSLIYPLAYMMSPLAAYIYKVFGISPLFLFNTCSFIIAAICETRIKLEETHISSSAANLSFKVIKDDLKSGLSFIKSEKGLLVIAVYFFISTLCAFGVDSLWLPYFKSVPTLGVVAFSYATAINVLGSFIGGFVQYRAKYPKHKKFAIAMLVYITVSVFDGGVLYAPFAVMLVVFFTDGFLSVTSYNIRLSTTQSYVPEEYRGRFNGAFQMVTNTGMIIGQLTAGALAEFLPIRPVVAGYMVLNIIGAFAVMYRGRKHVKPIFNRDV